MIEMMNVKTTPINIKTSRQGIGRSISERDQVTVGRKQKNSAASNQCASNA